jgi:tRNA pseudouridine55 synthase
MRDGMVVVDKPAGCTSHDVVAILRKVYGQRRVGHAGTLDPDATGVLLVGLGRVTRLLRFLQATGKVYEARVRFGVATDTLDASGVVLDQQPMPIGRDDVVAATGRFVGEISQLPPMVSAVKVGGRRLHELARRGEEVERAPRRVRVDRLDVTAFEPGAYPEATLRIECSSGTYVRSLAADLGAALGGCAHVRTLRRTRVGSFGVDEAQTLDTVRAGPDEVLISPAAAMRDLSQLRLDGDQARAVSHGVPFPALEVQGAGPCAIVGAEGELLAVYELRAGAWKPSVVVA